MEETDAITLAEHRQHLANGVDRGISVVPCRIVRGNWSLHVTDRQGGDWVPGGTARQVANKIRSWLLMGG